MMYGDLKTILICDPTPEQMTNMVEYCESNGLSLYKHDLHDVSDTSGAWDEIASFYFSEEADALMFKLKYK